MNPNNQSYGTPVACGDQQTKAPAPKTPSQTDIRLFDIYRSQADTSELLGKLEERLCAVLSEPVVPPDCTECDGRPSAWAPLSAELDRIADRQADTNAWLNRILSRLTV
jgi:hypothetical protein